mmetsp:Transcript_26432/g.77676  ORF Transcript_26432/g.77676 Transcript_26432/m.77676 type:complete len:553 (-) Transcript_26432:102-1760(-)
MDFHRSARARAHGRVLGEPRSWPAHGAAAVVSHPSRDGRDRRPHRARARGIHAGQGPGDRAPPAGKSRARQSLRAHHRARGRGRGDGRQLGDQGDRHAPHAVRAPRHADRLRGEPLHQALPRLHLHPVAAHPLRELEPGHVVRQRRRLQPGLLHHPRQRGGAGGAQEHPLRLVGAALHHGRHRKVPGAPRRGLAAPGPHHRRVLRRLHQDHRPGSHLRTRLAPGLAPHRRRPRHLLREQQVLPAARHQAAAQHQRGPQREVPPRALVDHPRVPHPPAPPLRAAHRLRLGGHCLLDLLQSLPAQVPALPPALRRLGRQRYGGRHLLELARLAQVPLPRVRAGALHRRPLPPPAVGRAVDLRRRQVGDDGSRCGGQQDPRAVAYHGRGQVRQPVAAATHTAPPGAPGARRPTAVVRAILRELFAALSKPAAARSAAPRAAGPRPVWAASSAAVSRPVRAPARASSAAAVPGPVPRASASSASAVSGPVCALARRPRGCSASLVPAHAALGAVSSGRGTWRADHRRGSRPAVHQRHRAQQRCPRADFPRECLTAR